MIVATATDLSSGARFYYTQQMFDILCSDLGAVRLSRAAASSSGVPVVLSPVTIDNYGGTCGYKEPPFLAAHRELGQRGAACGAHDPADEGAPLLRGWQAASLSSSRRWRRLRQSRHARRPRDPGGARSAATWWACLRRSTMRAGSSCSSSTRCPRRRSTGIRRGAPRARWTSCCRPPGCRSITTRTKRSSFCATRRRAGRCCGAFAIPAPFVDNGNPALAEVMRVPNLEVYVVDVSFARAQGRGGTRLSQQPADVLRAPCRSGRPAAGGGWNDRARLAGLPAVPEGPRRSNRQDADAGRQAGASPVGRTCAGRRLCGTSPRSAAARIEQTGCAVVPFSPHQPNQGQI